jgi:hypothetical protein
MPTLCFFIIYGGETIPITVLLVGPSDIGTCLGAGGDKSGLPVLGVKHYDHPPATKWI